MQTSLRRTQGKRAGRPALCKGSCCLPPTDALGAPAGNQASFRVRGEVTTATVRISLRATLRPAGRLAPHGQQSPGVRRCQAHTHRAAAPLPDEALGLC